MHAGSLGAQLQKLDSGDLDDASSATETASIADSDAPSEAALFSTGEHVGGPQAVPTVDSPQAYATPEQGQIRRSSRTPGTSCASVQGFVCRTAVLASESPIVYTLDAVCACYQYAAMC